MEAEEQEEFEAGAQGGLSGPLLPTHTWQLPQL